MRYSQKFHLSLTLRGFENGVGYGARGDGRGRAGGATGVGLREQCGRGGQNGDHDERTKDSAHAVLGPVKKGPNNGGDISRRCPPRCFVDKS